MNKQLSRVDYIFAFVFIFMLILAVAAFFYGVNYGTNQMAQKQQAQLDNKTKIPVTLTAYNQSYLVSFYHMVELPFKEFETIWFKDQSVIQLPGNTLEPAAMFREISKTADAKYALILPQSMPNSSPLLQEAQQNYMKSLKLFSEASNRFTSKANSLSTSMLIAEINDDAYFQQAIRFALLAQKQFFDSIVQWNVGLELDPLKGSPYSNDNPLNVAHWQGMNFNLKNAVIANIMLTNKYFEIYNPQDVVIHIDDMISTGKANKLKLNSIQQLADVLINTAAIRANDFINGNIAAYQADKIPQLPFFFSNQ